MGGVNEELHVFMKKYTGNSGELILHRQLAKNNIPDPQKASEVQRMNLTDSIIRDVLAPMMSRGRLPLARSELMGALGLKAGAAGIPMMIDGVRVLPDKIREESAEHFKSASEFILKQEMKKYGVKDLGAAESKVRLDILRGFVEHHFGKSGTALIDRKIEELHVIDLLKAPDYNKIMLMEYVLQDMLLFYVEPLKARMLRSELVSVLDIDLELAQGPTPEVEEAGRKVQEQRKRLTTKVSAELETDFEDLMVYMVKKELSRRQVGLVGDATLRLRNEVAFKVLSELLGGMTEFVFSRLLTDDEIVRGKFMLQYLQNYLEGVMLPDDAEKIYERVADILMYDS